MDVTDQDVRDWADSIRTLHARLTELERVCENATCCSLAGNEGHQECIPDPVLMALASGRKL
jgi:hypothetical protein